MRRIVTFDRVTADGYFAAPDGGLGWVVPDADLDQRGASSAAGAGTGTLLFGRRTYEMFESFWPRFDAEDAGTQDPHGAAHGSLEMRAMGKFINDAAKIVFSRTRRSVTWRNSRLVHELDPRFIEELKREPGPDIMIFGSGSIVSQLTTHGLIDEYQIIVSPVLLGQGRPLIHDVSSLSKLELLEATPFPSGNVMLRFARA